jgi:tRNA-2-methylthio-N6-dimethylallyladenosine synthase
MNLVRECRFKNSFIFKYSPRPGTKADELLPDDIAEDVKRRRNNELLALQNAISEEDNAALIGRDFEILVEGLSKAALKESHHDSFHPEPAAKVPVTALNPAQDVRSAIDSTGVCGESGDPHPQLVGRTRCDRIVVFDGNPRLIGSLTHVHIYDCSPTTLLGTIVTREFQHAANGLLPILG